LNQSLCSSVDPCFLGSCSVAGVCQNLPRNCTKEQPSNVRISACLNYSCVPFLGCQAIPFDCHNNISIKNGSCEVVKCNNVTEKCEKSGGACFALAALVGGLAAGGIAGIAVAATIAGLTIGGGTYALANSGSETDEQIISTNPLYEGDGSSGLSPVHADV